jgi:ribonuclease HI
VTVVRLIADGAVSGNPGPGGWSAILISGDHRRELSGGVLVTTNNRMELMGVIEGLRALTRPCTVEVLSDSAYVVNAHRKGWIERWQQNGWKTAAKKPVENQDLWRELLEQEARHTVHFELVKGHSGHELNDRADALAVAAREQIARTSVGALT